MVMVEQYPTRRQIFILILLAVPATTFIYMRLMPTTDWSVWASIEYSQFIYFYLMAFISFMALVAGLFVSDALVGTTNTRKMFTSMAFVTLALFFLLTSIATPATLYKNVGMEVMYWAARLAYLVSSIFFALAIVQWNRTWQERLYNGRYLFSFAILIILAVLAWQFFRNQEAFNQLSRDTAPVVQYLTAVITASLYLWASLRSWQLYQKDQASCNKALTISLILLATAQIFHAFGIWGNLSAMLHGPTTFFALAIPLLSFLRTFNSLRDLQPARYFAVLGSISIAALALIGGEMTRLISADVHRRFIVSVTLTQGAIGFAIMYIIVLSLDRLIKERTEALKREQKLRNELTRLIVHDLKNPLMVMTQGSNLLIRGQLGELTSEQKKLMGRMQQAGEKTLNLIDDILYVEKMEAGAIELKRNPVDLWKLLGDVAGHSQILAQSNQQTLTLRLSSHLPIIQADEALLRRVVENIITNAIKFTPENGRIAVRAISDDSHLMIEVADSGPGVSPTHREQIFEKYSQLHSTERRGVGLGLTFCKMVIEAHQGTIAVEDSELGGALFKITLPLHTSLMDESYEPQQTRKRMRIKPSLYTTLFSRL